MSGGECYTSYIAYLNSISTQDIHTTNFKRNAAYNEILEHVSYELGSDYLRIVQNAPYNMTDADVRAYVDYNDRIGDPVRGTYTGRNGTTIVASPSSLRYIYHALLIVRELASKGSRRIVEVGGGYGGLCAAIHYFAKMIGLQIESYAIIDLPAVNVLIDKYLRAINPAIRYSLYDAARGGEDVPGTDLFFISNYCFTEIQEQYRRAYIEKLLSKVWDGFIIWQTGLIGLNYDIPFNKSVEEEVPQTSKYEKNYFVSISRRAQ